MIRFLGYDPESKTLRVQFNKHVYDYFLVPPDIGGQAEAMLAGNTNWLYEHVKGVYPFRRVV